MLMPLLKIINCVKRELGAKTSMNKHIKDIILLTAFQSFPNRFSCSHGKYSIIIVAILETAIIRIIPKLSKIIYFL